MDAKTESLLEIHDLSVSFRMYDHALGQRDLQVISDLHLTVKPGEIVAVAGSSGSGKSLLASAILGILPDNATVKGHLHYKGQQLTVIAVIHCIDIREQTVAHAKPLSGYKSNVRRIIPGFLIHETKVCAMKPIDR